VDSEQPRRELFCCVLQSVLAFLPYRNGSRIRTDSVEGRIRMDSDGFLDPKYGSHQPSGLPIVPLFISWRLIPFITGSPACMTSQSRDVEQRREWLEGSDVRFLRRLTSALSAGGVDPSARPLLRYLAAAASRPMLAQLRAWLHRARVEAGAYTRPLFDSM